MARLLDTINSPADVKKLPLDQLPVLAQEIRVQWQKWHRHRD
jgi:deoxyxylulose-5-phosphate synthase